MNRLAETLAYIVKEIASVKDQAARTFTEGPVAAVDPERKLARIQVGERNGAPVLGPWVPYAQHAGAFKGHVPVSVGQQMTMIAPGGDWSRAGLTPLTFSNANPSPSSKGDENVWTFGDVSIELRGAEVRINVGGAQVEVRPGDVKVTAPKVVVEAGEVALGGEGGKPVARIGDMVHVGSGSSSGLWPIVEGSGVVSAVD